MRGNDLLMGSVDVMVTDTLTGNILMKVFSSFTTGGSYESLGYGYGPGIGFGWKRNVLILSRASGVPVVANALEYAASLAKGNVVELAESEFAKAKAAGYDNIVKEFTKETKKSDDDEEVVAPPKEIVTGTVSGIDIMDLDDACTALWKKKIYAESGMGCTGPMIMVSEANLETAISILAEAGYVSKESIPC